MKLPFLRALRAAFPEARVTWLAGKGPSAFAGPLAPLAEGLIDEVVDDAGIGRKAAELLHRPLAGSPLQGRRFDLVIDTQTRLLTTLVLRRIPHGTFVSACAGFRLSDRKPPGGDKRLPALAKRLLQLVEAASGKPARPEAPLHPPGEAVAAAATLLPGAAPRYAGLVPGAGWRAKCWPLENHIALARRLREQELTPVVLLGPDEADWVPQVREALPDALLPLQDARAGRVTPALTIALGRRLGVAVAGDCGAGHMLAAAGTPMVSLFGPTAPEKFAPMTPRLTVLTAQDHGGDDEVAAIPVDAVAKAVHRLLETPEAAKAQSHGPGR
ncbi:lipopolysaccharide heptosyltransferase family protein [Ferruginivarius sediminum]|uniref:Lipopolysaccharide heptosyltransferase family protein n=2 Tax=Ferruginivarius sediminum TaxID=2661937 RepID=A0A369TAU0_9PROT|nr:lipopolysaccharide heptosyltransferase family protein [Ferruginivarius sediminum]